MNDLVQQAWAAASTPASGIIATLALAVYVAWGIRALYVRGRIFPGRALRQLDPARDTWAAGLITGTDRLAALPASACCARLTPTS